MKATVCVLILSCFLASGCTSVVSALPASREKSALEEALDENSRLKESLDAEVRVNHRLAYELEMSRIELQKAQAGLVAHEASAAATVPIFQDYEVASVAFGLLTGISDWDDNFGYDGIQVHLLLKDSDGDVIKRKGNVIFDLVDISRGQEQVIMSWPLPAEVLGSHWQSVPPGFRIKLPWQGDVAYGDQCVLRASFTDAFGRAFGTSRLFTLEPRPEIPKNAEQQ